MKAAWNSPHTKSFLITKSFSQQKRLTWKKTWNSKIMIYERKNIRLELQLRNVLPFIHSSPFPSLGARNVTADKCFGLRNQKETYHWATSWHHGSWCLCLPETTEWSWSLVCSTLFFFKPSVPWLLGAVCPPFKKIEEERRTEYPGFLLLKCQQRTRVCRVILG